MISKVGTTVPLFAVRRRSPVSVTPLSLNINLVLLKPYNNMSNW